MRRLRPLLVVFAIALVALVAACADSDDDGPEASEVGTAAPAAAGAEARNQLGYELPAAPEVGQGPLPTGADADLDAILDTLSDGPDPTLIRGLADYEDPRLGWLLSDLLRFFPQGPVHDASIDAFERLTMADLGADPVAARSPWQSVTDHLFAWDLPAPPGYVDAKARIFTLIEPGWRPFFDAPSSDIDWRFVSWGGVLIDDRPLGDPEQCPRGCIPALDDPAVTDAAGGDWYADEEIVFGVVVGDEARAYPRNIMEVHEMVNDTLGGRRLGIPYCTLCGSAQAYFTDSVPDGVEVPVLRTSGLLSRSNKVMYDLVTRSVFDTFTGRAISGPLHERGLELAQTSVVSSTWGEWKAAHPETTIVAEDGGIGRSYPDDPLGGRDDNGPIFPVGDVDDRLPVQAPVLGVESPDGRAVAFPVEEARAALADGGAVELAGVTVIADADGLRAEAGDGSALTSHQAFWFAWSQFMPDTLLWTPPG